MLPNSRPLRTWRHKSVSRRPHRLDRDGTVSRLELLPEVSDVDLEHVRAGVVVVAPNGVEDLAAGQHLVGVAHQVREQLELPSSEANAVACPAHLARPEVELDAGR